MFPAPLPHGLMAEIASVCSVSRPTVSNWFRSPEKVSTISRKHAELLIEHFHLNVQPAWLAEGEGEMRPYYSPTALGRTEKQKIGIRRGPLEPRRYQLVWIDKTPDRPHFPDDDVMRWGLRPDDWWEIWPDLLAHPCAYLFAPKHPHREGPPDFVDWVKSWPPGLDWEPLGPPEFHDRVRSILADLPPREDAVADGGSTPEVRYAAPGRVVVTPTETTEAETAGAMVDAMLRMLVEALLSVPEADRENTARLLSTLALAPDSARTLQALKATLTKPASIDNPHQIRRL